jgi:hypothetical protein
MKKADTFEPLIQTHISDWMREMWEVEAQHPPMIGLKFKFLLPEPRKRQSHAKTGKQTAAKAGKRAAVKA